jgi:Flp pilus assembly protein TadD
MSRDVLDKARQLLRRGQASQAAELLRAGLQAGASDAALHSMLGYALYHSNHLSEARLALEAGLKLFPFDPVLHEANARLRWLDGEGEQFANQFLAAVAAQPGDAILRFKCADLLRLAGNMTAAERLLREALAHSPGDITTMAWLGVLLDETGQFEEAAAMLGATVQAYPDEPMLKLNFAHLLMRSGRPEEALREILWVRGAFPDIQLAITYEWTALKQLGDPRAAWLGDYERHVQTYDIAAPAGFASIADFNAALGERLRKLQDAKAHPLEQSLRGGLQTNDNLIFVDDPLLKTYFEALDAPIRAYIDALGDDPDHPLEQRKSERYSLSGCWSVLLRPGGFHVNHTHPQGWISSSYYVSLPARMSVTDSQEGWIKFGEPRWPIPGCGVEKVVQPREGLLVLFPSYMWHGTIPFSSGERLTAPFDVVPSVAGAK